MRRDRQIQWGLRASNPAVDVSVIAQQYGQRPRPEGRSLEVGRHCPRYTCVRHTRFRSGSLHPGAQAVLSDCRRAGCTLVRHEVLATRIRQIAHPQLHARLIAQRLATVYMRVHRPGASRPGVERNPLARLHTTGTGYHAKRVYDNYGSNATVTSVANLCNIEC